MLTHYNADKLWIMTFEIYKDILTIFKDLPVLWRKVSPLKKDACLEFGVSGIKWPWNGLAICFNIKYLFSFLCWPIVGDIYAVLYLLSSWGFHWFSHEEVNKGLQGPFWCGLLELHAWVWCRLAAAIEKRILVCRSNNQLPVHCINTCCAVMDQWVRTNSQGIRGPWKPFLDH